MADLSDVFIALPGGIGTFEEFLEVATWTQLGLQRKACGLVNVAGYYDGLLSQADRAVEDGFLSIQHRHMLSWPIRILRSFSILLANTSLQYLASGLRPLSVNAPAKIT